MLSQLVNNCPHCRTRSAGFYIAHQWPSLRGTDYANILAVCGVCNLGILIVSSRKYGSSHEDFIRLTQVYSYGQYEIVNIWPRGSPEIPSGVPENISSFYMQGLDSLSTRHWDAAGAMFRKTLDTATKALKPELKSLNLYTRINRLVDEGVLTSAMGDWSHEIRIDGNEAVHDEEPETEEDARSAQKFTEAFLTYVFSLPRMVEDNRKSRELTKAA